VVRVHWLFPERMSRGSLLVSGALVIQSGLWPCLLVQPGSPGWNAGRGGWPGWARCWVLKAQVLPVLLGQTGIAPNRPGSSAVRVGWGWRRSGCWDCLYFENCIVDASIICSCQVIKGTRWMPWHQEPMKDVGACDKPRGVGNQTLIRGFPNGETCRA
jgi:hypothetical protein